MLTPTFPPVITNTIRSTFVSCPHRSFFSTFLKRAPQSTSIDLHAGGSFAKGMEVARKAFYIDHLSEDDAVLAGFQAVLDTYGAADYGDEAVKTAERVAGALVYYFTQWPLSSDFIKPFYPHTTPAIEFSFAIPLPINNPDTGEPLLYAGRFDMLGESENIIYIVDEKTTSSLGPTWGKRYNMSSQFTGYAWGCRQYNVPVGGVLLRGISILKTKYDKAQHIMYRPDWQIERWYQQLLRDIQRMIECYSSGVFDYAIADACGSYSGCPYQTVCSVPNELEWLETETVHSDYDPLTRTNLPGKY